MKKFLAIFAIAGTLVACNNSSEAGTTTDTTAVDTNKTVNTTTNIDTNKVVIDTIKTPVDTTKK